MKRRKLTTVERGRIVVFCKAAELKQNLKYTSGAVCICSNREACIEGFIMSVKIVGVLNPLKSSELNTSYMLFYTNRATPIFEVAELIKSSHCKITEIKIILWSIVIHRCHWSPWKTWTCW